MSNGPEDAPSGDTLESEGGESVEFMVALETGDNGELI